MVFLADVASQVLNLYDTKFQSSCQDYVHCYSPLWVVELEVVAGGDDIPFSFFSLLSNNTMGL